ncbi:hypothetical protein D3C87_94890 [compost metagenome]
MNMTLDGFCDHTSGIPDEELHQHYTDLLNHSGTALYGRITYELMQYWQTVLENPTGDKAMDDFAVAIDRIPKVVFSHTLQNAEPLENGWKSASLAKKDLKATVLDLREQTGKNILVCSPGLINALTKLHLIDEYQLCIHPVIGGSKLPLFKEMNEQLVLKLLKTKSFDSGVVLHYYDVVKKNNK